MSRLATLSSTLPHYLDALKELTSLYVHRGYPDKLVEAWLKNNITERWEKRLAIPPPRSTELLVLKTEFNSAWNYFNAQELSETIFGYWRTSLDKAERGEFTVEYPLEASNYSDTLSAHQGYS